MKRFILSFVAGSVALVAAGYVAVLVAGAVPAWPPWCLAIGTNGALMSLMALGALRGDRLPRALLFTFIGMFVLCAGVFCAALAMPANEGAGGPLLLGLPLRTAIVLGGAGIIPIFILPFAYAFTFDSNTLSSADLDRVREAHAALDLRAGPVK